MDQLPEPHEIDHALAQWPVGWTVLPNGNYFRPGAGEFPRRDWAPTERHDQTVFLLNKFIEACRHDPEILITRKMGRWHCEIDGVTGMCDSLPFAVAFAIYGFRPKEKKSPARKKKASSRKK